MIKINKFSASFKLIIIFAVDISLKLIYLPFFYYHHSTTGAVIGVVDGLAYLLKSLEIANGNFLPIRTHGMGLSLLTAPIFKLIGEPSLFVNMVYAHFINIFISSLYIFPLYFICKRIFTNKKYTYLTITLSIFSFWLLYSAIGFFAEPLFTFVLLIVLLCVINIEVQPQQKKYWLILASIFAGLGYWIKPTGILLLIILLAYWAYKSYKSHWSYKSLIIITVIFLAITTPVFYQRYIHFGSPMNYGENSRYFVNNYNEAWEQEGISVSFIEYLKTHSFPDYINKFIFFGLGGLIFSLLVITLPYSIFSVWGMLLGLRSPPLRPLLITIAVWFIALIPVYQVFFTPRHLFPLIPLMAIFATYALLSLRGTTGESDTAISSFLFLPLIIITALFFFVGFIFPQYYFIPPRSQQEMEFGRWVATNLRGKLAVSIAGDFVMMNLSDATIAKRGLFDITAPRSGLELVYPGYFENPQKLKKWMLENDTKYVALTRGNQQQRIITPPIIYAGEIATTAKGGLAMTEEGVSLRGAESDEVISSTKFQKIKTFSDPRLNWQIDIYELKN